MENATRNVDQVQEFNRASTHATIIHLLEEMPHTTNEKALAAESSVSDEDIIELSGVRKTGVEGIDIMSRKTNKEALAVESRVSEEDIIKLYEYRKTALVNGEQHVMDAPGSDVEVNGHVGAFSQPQTEIKQKSERQVRTRYTRSMTFSLPPARVFSLPSSPPPPKRRYRQESTTNNILPVKKQRHDITTEPSGVAEQDRHESDDEAFQLMEVACKPSTQSMYKRMQLHWEDWCKRHLFGDGDIVTPEKFQAYWREYVSPHIHRDKNPSQSILPFRVNATEYYDGELPRKSMAIGHRSAVRYLYIDQCIRNGVTPDIDSVFRTPEIQALTSEYFSRLKLDPKAPPAKLSRPKATPISAPHPAVQSKSNLAVLQLLQDDLPPALALRDNLKILWTKDSKNQLIDNEKWLTIARARLQLAYDYYRINQAYEISSIQLGDLYPIQFTLRGEENFRPSFGIGIAHIQTPPSALPTFTKLVRHEDVEICPVACLAFYLLSLWSGQQGPPDFSQYSWEAFFLMFEDNSDSVFRMNQSSLQKSRNLVTEILRDISSASHPNIDPEEKVPGYPFSTQARDYNITRHTRVDNWNRLDIKPSYIRSTQTSTPYRMTAIQSKAEVDQVRVTREESSPSLELQRQIFPFVEDMFEDNADWIKWINNIMDGRPESEGRPEEARPIYFTKYIPAIRIGILLVYLRKVILQDAAALIACKPPLLGTQHRPPWFYSHPVFDSREFNVFVRTVQSEKGLIANEGRGAMSSITLSRMDRDVTQNIPPATPPRVNPAASCSSTSARIDCPRRPTPTPSPTATPLSTENHNISPESTAKLGQQIQTIQSTLASMAKFMETFRDETKAAIEVCVERSESAHDSVGRMHGRITRMEQSIQGLWTKLDDYGTVFVEQAMDEMEAQHRRQGEQLRTMRRIVGQQYPSQAAVSRFDQQEDTSHHHHEMYDLGETESNREEGEEKEEEEEEEEDYDPEETETDREDELERFSTRRKHRSQHDAGTSRRHSTVNVVDDDDDDDDVVVDDRSPYEALAGVESQEDGNVEGIARDNDGDVEGVAREYYGSVEGAARENDGEEGEERKRKRTIVKNGTQVEIYRPYYYRRRSNDAEGPLFILADRIASLYEQLPDKEVKAQMRSFVMEPRSIPYDVLWDEWFVPKEGKASIWSMDKVALEWRTYQDSASRQRYYFKRKIVSETLKMILAAEAEAEGDDTSTLEERIVQGKKAAQEMILRHGNISKFIETLRQHRKT